MLSAVLVGTVEERAAHPSTEAAMSSATLTLWIAGLRLRLERGELDRLGSVDLGYGSLPAATSARILLADQDHLDSLPPGRLDPTTTEARRRDLDDDFGRLLQLLTEAEAQSA